jgi:hypothetical protein
MDMKTSVVVTSISKPNKALRLIAKGCKNHGYKFTVIGDVSSPVDFHLKNCNFLSLKMQEEIDLKYPRLCPQKHYARKNIGYLIEIQSNADIIIDTDDDNLPYESFWKPKDRILTVPTAEKKGWVNVYKYFTRKLTWPRGFPLNKISSQNGSYESLPLKMVDCPIQQGLANENPDVDAIYRLINSKPVVFNSTRKIALSKGVWCPFNSQNTAWWKETFPLLYLPSYCSFRMTDIIRSFVAQRIAWENDWSILFHEPTVWQERNEHDLMRDFEDEIPGYLNNELLCNELDKLQLRKGGNELTYNLQVCYEKLVEICVVKKEELHLLRSWEEDINSNTC